MNFIPVSPSQYKLLEPYFRGQVHAHSAYCLSGLVAWNNCAFNNYYALENGAVYIYETPAASPSCSYLLLPIANDRDFTPADLVSALKKTGRAELRFVPQDYLDRHRAALEKLFIIHEQPEYEDYIYLQKDLASLEGRKYAKKRNLVRQFEKAFLATNRVGVETISNSNIGKCVQLAEKWYETHARTGHALTEELSCDRKALMQTLHNFGETGAGGLLVSIDGAPAGLAIASRLKADTAVINFEKALEETKGLYQYLDRECAARLCASYTYVSKESDLSDPGLRQAKESYFPTARVKSYSLRLRP